MGRASTAPPDRTSADDVPEGDATLPRLVARNAAEFPDSPALTAGPSRWTWAQAEQDAHRVAAGLAELGLRRGQTLLIMAGSGPEHWLADVAATHLGAVPCTVYATLSQDQVARIARHSRARVVLLGGAEELRTWAQALRAVDTIDRVVLLDDDAAAGAEDPRVRSFGAVRATGRRVLDGDPEAVARRAREVAPGDPAAILYTSGEHKGVVLTHRNVCFAAAAVHQVAGTGGPAPRLSCQPLAHIAERVVSIYSAVHDVAHVHFCAGSDGVATGLARVRPELFFAVPQVWEVLTGALGADPRRLAEPDRRRLRERAGLDRVRWAGSGAAGDELRSWFSALDVQLFELWGMTETTGCVTSNRPGAHRPGTAGPVVPGMQVRTAADGEVLVRGPLVCAGYLQPDGAIVPAADADGWLRTGDIGMIDADGYLTITDRKRDLITGPGGKNIAPGAVESLLTEHPLVAAAAVFGDRRPYLVALLVLDEQRTRDWARERGIGCADLAGLARHPAVRSEVDRAVRSANAHLGRFEQVRRHRLLGERWSAETGELAPTSTLRRGIVAERYAAELAVLYEEQPPG
ncbi:AMP-dependent synthetase/ligase [Saccharopolyspora montiporae]|uniref:AMP-dependent synthetase/ligase n=1 Tax=Saccharopolyspora montiporae TaxID=2781240 RepID=UPI001D14B2BE|nr:AMP-dependent synthetase/ligase [Saccharopolyspora sp. HNM0983]